MLEAYRDYQRALAADDTAAAEDAAFRAWRASEAADGDGGRTAVLAFNAAQVSLQLHHDAQALEPARRASALAQAGAEGVNADAARVLLGWALAAPDYDQAKSILTPALQQSPAGDADNIWLFGASVALAQHATIRADWPTAQSAWRSAMAHTTGAVGDEPLARAEAYFGVGLVHMARGEHAAAIRAFNRSATLLPDAPPLSGSQIEWSKTPSAHDFFLHYPSSALDHGLSGVALLSCTANADRKLNCAPVYATPVGLGFAEAAVQVARSFRLSRQDASAWSDPQKPIKLAINFLVDAQSTEVNALSDASRRIWTRLHLSE